MLFVVDMMITMKEFIKRFNIMQTTMHPIDSKLNECHVEDEISNISSQTNIIHSRVSSSPSRLNDVISDRREQAIHRHSQHGNFDLRVTSHSR